MRTPGGGSISDMGPTSGSSDSDSDEDTDDGPDPADEFGSELGGDPVESSGTDNDTGSSSSSSSSDSDSSDNASSSSSGSSGGRNPQEAPGGDPNGRQSGSGTLTDQGVGTADRFTPSSEDRAQETADNLRNLGAEARVTEAGTVEFDDPGARDRRITSQREEFRADAAEELDTTPDNVEVTFDEDSNEFRAEQQLTDDQQRINRLTGGRFESVVEAGSDAREAAADAVSGPLETATDAATLPGRLVGGAAISGVEATTDFEVSEVEAPDISAEQALGLGAAGVVTPEPATSIGGGALAAGAALTLGAAELQRRRNSEIEAPQESDFVRSELDVGANDADVTEISPGEFGPSTTEVDFAADGIEASEIDTPDQPARSTSAEVGVPAVEAAGILEQVEEDELEEEEDDDVIGPDDILEPQDDTNELARQSFEQGQYEVERIYGEEQFDRVPERELPEEPGPFDDIGNAGISGVGEPETFGEGEFIADRDFSQFIQDEQPATVERGGLRFPADAVGAEVSAGVEAQGFEVGQTGIGTETGTRVQSGAMSDVEAPLVSEQRSAGALDQPLDSAFGQSSTAVPNVEAVGFEAPAANANANVFTETTVEANGFEAVEMNQMAEQTAVEVGETGTNQDRREPRFGLSDDDLDDLDDIGTEIDDAQFEYELDLPDFAR